MNTESALLINIWNTVEDQFPKGQRIEAVMQIMRHLEDAGYEITDFEEASEENVYIEAAYSAIVEPVDTVYEDNYDGFGAED